MSIVPHLRPLDAPHFPTIDAQDAYDFLRADLTAEGYYEGDPTPEIAAHARAHLATRGRVVTFFNRYGRDGRRLSYRGYVIAPAGRVEEF